MCGQIVGWHPAGAWGCHAINGILTERERERSGRSWSQFYWKNNYNVYLDYLQAILYRCCTMLQKETVQKFQKQNPSQRITTQRAILTIRLDKPTTCQPLQTQFYSFSPTFSSSPVCSPGCRALTVCQGEFKWHTRERCNTWSGSEVLEGIWKEPGRCVNPK